VKGFTFLELIIVLAIIGVLCWIVVKTPDWPKIDFMTRCHQGKALCEDMWKKNHE
jgi:prepilin-type N-terminal cleavage/methylation domain-containing protein